MRIARAALTKAEAIRRIHEACDDLVRSATDGHRPPVSCRLGCDHCCKQPVFITPLEGLAIRNMVDSSGLAEAVSDRTARYRAEIAARRHGAAGLRSLLRSVRGLGAPPTRAERRAVFGIHCPFLENGRCTIYAARPLMCREHISFDDPRKCARDEPFRGLDKPRFSEVSAYLTMRDVPPGRSMRPVFEFRQAAEDAERAAPVSSAGLRKALRWKSG